MTSFTRCTQRPPFVKVPLFSKNDAPGSIIVKYSASYSQEE